MFSRRIHDASYKRFLSQTEALFVFKVCFGAFRSKGFANLQKFVRSMAFLKGDCARCLLLWITGSGSQSIRNRHHYRHTTN